jgi:hypothetical protein
MGFYSDLVLPRLVILRCATSSSCLLMRAIPIASLRSILLICIWSTAFAWRPSMQIIRRRSRLSSVHSHVDDGPVSRPMRTVSGAL